MTEFPSLDISFSGHLLNKHERSRCLLPYLVAHNENLRRIDLEN